MNGKERIDAVLDGRIPDKIPHFELDFQLDMQVFNISKWSSEENYLLVCEKLIERYDWAAIIVPDNLISPAKDRFGDRAAVYCANGNGTFWMPSGDQIMDFTVRLFEDLPSLHEEARRKRDASIELAYSQIRQGADFICINSD